MSTKEKQIVWRFTINGTAHNPFEQWGLKYNPFPQHGTYKLDVPDRALQSLGEANMTPTTIRQRLGGIFTPEFIASIVQRYEMGAQVHCVVTCTWAEALPTKPSTKEN